LYVQLNKVLNLFLSSMLFSTRPSPCMDSICSLYWSPRSSPLPFDDSLTSDTYSRFDSSCPVSSCVFCTPYFVHFLVICDSHHVSGSHRPSRVCHRFIYGLFVTLCFSLMAKLGRVFGFKPSFFGPCQHFRSFLVMVPSSQNIGFFTGIFTSTVLVRDAYNTFPRLANLLARSCRPVSRRAFRLGSVFRVSWVCPPVNFLPLWH